MGWRVRSKMNRSSVSISDFIELSVGGRSVTMNDRVTTNGLPDKRHQVIMIAMRNLSNSDSSEALGL